MEIVFRPLPGWPKAFTHPRHKADFAPDFSKSLLLLSKELRHLKSKGVVVQTAHREDEISVTVGRPLAGTTPKHPGVIVLADTMHGALNWTCDRYHSWIHNLRNVALYMERQRLLAGQGIGTGTEAYMGHKMLPGPITATAGSGAAPTMTIEAAARFVAEKVGRTADALIKNRVVWQNAYREAAAAMHPDQGGSPVDWAKLQDAKQLLDNLHQGRN